MPVWPVDPLDAAVGLSLTLGWTADSLLLRSRLRAARRDPLTGLYTRQPWANRARRVAAQPSALVLLADVDAFKRTNDMFGHLAGDAVLAVTGRRLAAWAGQRRGVAGRLGGDEFAAVVICRAGDIETALDSLATAFAEPVAAGPGVEVPVSATVGAALATGCPRGDLRGALAAADAAMYRAKQAGTRWQLAAHRHGDVIGRAPLRRARYHGS
jgi:diguanylate cyclase (GGDEF)-like protein